MNKWLPGDPGFRDARASDEPGWATDRATWNMWRGPTTPLNSLINAIILIVVAAVVGFWAFALAGPLNLGAFLVATIAILAFLGIAVFNLVRGIRQWSWRRKNIAVTGGRYLRAWQQTPRP
jgi:ABC-type multidrug transport system fused ATPase/permease subunit